MKTFLQRTLPVSGFLLIPLLLIHCYSLSNFKTAGALGTMEDGKPQVSTIIDVSTPGAAAAIMGEFNIRYPLIPSSLEMGNKVWFTAIPVLDAGITSIFGLIPDLKYTFLSFNKFFFALDVEADMNLIGNSKLIKPTFGLGSTLLLTIQMADWLSITIAPKIKYYFEGFKLLNTGVIITFDFGKDFGIIPEIGFFDQYSTIDDEHDPLFHMALGLRFDSKPAAKKI